MSESIRLICQELTLECPRGVLVSISPVLEACLLGGFAEGASGEIRLEETSEEELQAFYELCALTTCYHTTPVSSKLTLEQVQSVRVSIFLVRSTADR